MANFDLDFITQGLPKFIAHVETRKPVDTFLSSLFGDAPMMGTEGVEGVAMEWRKYNPQVAEEAVRGADPNRINYGTSFNADYLVPNYYHMTEAVGVSAADHKVFGEPIEENVNSHDRVLKVFADKVRAMQDAVANAKEQMAADALFEAKVSNKSGNQVFPMSASVMALSGAGLLKKATFNKVIGAAFETARKANAAFRPTALIMNPADATDLFIAIEDLINKDTYNLGVTRFEYKGNGLTKYGTVNTPAGTLDIYAYLGVNNAGNYYVPQGKALLCGSSVGAWAYGRVRAFENGVPGYSVQEERMRTYEKGEGDMAHYEVEYQTAPLPVITKLDSFGVITGIN